MKKITQEEQDQIRSSIQKAESQTSAEIVPMIVSDSDPYWNVHWAWGAFFAFLASVYAYYDSRSMHRTWTVSHVVLLQALFGAVGFLLPFLSFIKRLSIPKKWLWEVVHRRCLANFMEAGLLNTRDRTGVLIYISLLERRIQILADHGISHSISNDYWDDQVKHLAQGIGAGKGVVALCQVIEEVGRKLSNFWPRREDDKNELPDTVRLGHPKPEGE